MANLLKSSGGRLLEYTRAVAVEFASQTRYLTKGFTTYKILWNGAELSVDGRITKTCPFFFVLPVDFDSTDQVKNPLQSEALSEVNNAIKDILEYREKLIARIENVMSNVTVNTSCSISLVNTMTVLIGQNSNNNSVSMNPSCVIGSLSDKNTGEQVTKDEEGKDIPTKSEDELHVKGTTMNTEVQTYQFYGPSMKGLRADDSSNDPVPVESTLSGYSNQEDKEDNMMFIIIGAVAGSVVFIILLGIIIWLIKRNNKNKPNNGQQALIYVPNQQMYQQPSNSVRINESVTPEPVNDKQISDQ